LAFNSTDYLAAENESSIVQHYWSLSVEEQFYIVWPLLILAAIAVASWLRRGKEADSVGQTTARVRAIAIALAVVFAASLLFSIIETARSQPTAYFVTPTRAWEFAAGGLLAFVPATVLSGLGDRAAVTVRSLASWFGLVAILGAAFAFTGESPFPGYIALLPVVGTVLVIWAGTVDHRWAPTAVAGFGPVQLIGDLSYAIYLWHWPLIIVYPYLRGNEPEFKGGLLIIAASIVLAAATKYFIEDPVRTRQFWIKNRRRSFAFAASGMAVILSVVVFGSVNIQSEAAELAREAAVLDRCLGAALAENLENPACVDFLATEDRLFPALASRNDDTAEQYNCYVPLNADPVYKKCTVGDLDSATRIALTGDSHAASLIPGLSIAAEKGGWAVDVLVGNSCQFASGTNCAVQEEFEAKIIDGDYDMVLATGTRKYQPTSQELVKYWEGAVDAGVQLVPIVDVPTYLSSTEICIERSAGELLAASDCMSSRDEALFSEPDNYGVAGKSLGLNVIDLTSIFCGEENCPAVIGHAIVYRDTSSHITATFSRTLASSLYDQIDAIIP